MCFVLYFMCIYCCSFARLRVYRDKVVHPSIIKYMLHWVINDGF